MRQSEYFAAFFSRVFLNWLRCYRNVFITKVVRSQFASIRVNLCQRGILNFPVHSRWEKVVGAKNQVVNMAALEKRMHAEAK